MESDGLDAEGIRMDVLHVNCETCLVRGLACNDCVVNVLLDAPGGPSSAGTVDLDADEQAALEALADSGLVPPLRLIQGARRVQSVQAPLELRDYA